MSREKIEVEKFIEIPYKNKGRDHDGCDCWGLVYLVYKEEYNINLPTLSDWYEDASDGEYVKDVVEKNKPLISAKKKDVPEYGDICLFKMGGNPCHVGIYLERGLVLHILKGTNSVCERIDGIRLKGRLEGYYEI